MSSNVECIEYLCNKIQDAIEETKLHYQLTACELVGSLEIVKHIALSETMAADEDGEDYEPWEVN